MSTRRFHERPVCLIHVRSTNPRNGGAGNTWHRDEHRFDPRTGTGATATTWDPESSPDGPTAVLLEIDGDRALLLPPSSASAIHVDGPERLDHAIALAAGAERALRRDLDRLRRHERLVVLADLLASADTTSDIFQALSENLAPVIDVWITLVFYRARDGAELPATLRPIPAPELGSERLSLEASPGGPLPHLGQLSWNDPLEPGDLLAPLRRIFEATPIRRMAFAAIGEDAIVFVADRRAGREFEAQDWDLLRVAVRQAEAALRRHGRADAALEDPRT